jgi:hypothetical protein
VPSTRSLRARRRRCADRMSVCLAGTHWRRPDCAQSVPKRDPKPVIRQPTPTTKPNKNGPEIVNFRPVL